MNDKKPTGMNRKRVIQRIVHTVDNVSGRDLPHAIIHAQDAAKAKSLPEAKEHIKRVMGHLKEASEQSGLLSEAIKSVPGVQREANRLAIEQAKSDGLVQDQKAKASLKSAKKKLVSKKKPVVK